LFDSELPLTHSKKHRHSFLADDLHGSQIKMENATKLERVKIQGDLLDIADQMSRLHTSKTSQLKQEIKLHLGLINKITTDLYEVKTELQCIKDSFLMRQIVSCMETTLIEQIKLVDGRYGGQTFLELHQSTFSDYPMWTFGSQESKKMYLKFLQSYTKADDFETSLKFVNYTRAVKESGNANGHPIPPPDKQSVESFKGLDLDDEEWPIFLNMANQVALMYNKPLIYKIKR
jgi:hypothetical protein